MAVVILTHCVAGVEHFGSGVMKGVTGIVTNPYKEAKKGGAGGAPPAPTCRFYQPRDICSLGCPAGFMKGVGKGLLGAVVKPTAGVLDLATDLSTAIKATATQAGAHRCEPAPFRFSFCY